MLIKRKGNYLKLPLLLQKFPDDLIIRFSLILAENPQVYHQLWKKYLQFFGLNRKDYANEIR